MTEGRSLWGGSQKVRGEAWCHGIGWASFAIDRTEELQIVEVKLSGQIKRKLEICVGQSKGGQTAGEQVDKRCHLTTKLVFWATYLRRGPA